MPRRTKVWPPKSWPLERLRLLLNQRYQPTGRRLEAWRATEGASKPVRPQPTTPSRSLSRSYNMPTSNKLLFLEVLRPSFHQLPNCILNRFVNLFHIPQPFIPNGFPLLIILQDINQRLRKMLFLSDNKSRIIMAF